MRGLSPPTDHDVLRRLWNTFRIGDSELDRKLGDEVHIELGRIAQELAPTPADAQGVAGRLWHGAYDRASGLHGRVLEIDRPIAIARALSESFVAEAAGSGAGSNLRSTRADSMLDICHGTPAGHTRQVKSDSELVSAAHLNFIGSFRKLAEHSPRGEIRSERPVFAFVTGLPIPLFNGCVVVEPITAAQLRMALAWLSERGLPYQVSIVEQLAPDLGYLVADHGLLRDPAPYPGMVLHPVPMPPEPPPNVTVAPGLEPGLADFLPWSFATDPDVRVFTARLDGRPVGTSIAIRTGDVAGVYGVGTIPNARRRGVGTAASWAAVAAGRAWNCDAIVLQATEMGLPIYEQMGFRTVVRYITFSSGGG